MGEPAFAVTDKGVESFIAHGPSGTFLAKAEKDDWLLSVAADDLPDFQFIAINQRNFGIIHVDVDNISVCKDCIIEPAFDTETFESVGLPVPTYSVISNGHRFHAFWLLERSLPLSASFKSLSFYHDIRAKIVFALGADRCCNIAGAVRNPFYKDAKVRRLASRPYRLGELNLPDVKIDARAFAAFRAEYAPGSRNSALFQALLRHAKEQVRDSEQVGRVVRTKPATQFG